MKIEEEMNEIEANDFGDLVSLSSTTAMTYVVNFTFLNFCNYVPIVFRAKITMDAKDYIRL